jgi:hypothetical protein
VAGRCWLANGAWCSNGSSGFFNPGRDLSSDTTLHLDRPGGSTAPTRIRSLVFAPVYHLFLFFKKSLKKIHLISSVLIRFTTTLDMLFLHDTARNVRCGVRSVSHGIVVHFLFLSFLFARTCEIT